MNQITPASLPPENSLNPENNPEQNEAQTRKSRS